MKYYRLLKVILLVIIFALNFMTKPVETFSKETENPLKIEKIIGLSKSPGTFRTVSSSGCDVEPYVQQGLVVGSDGTIYIGDNAEGQIEMFNKEMKSIGNFGMLGTEEGQFQYLSALAIDELDQIYAVDSYLACVQIFKKDGIFIKRFGEQGDAINQLKTPNDLCILKSGEILVSDYYKGLKVFSKEGKYLREFSKDKSIEPKKDLHIEEIEIDGDGYVYIYLYNKEKYEISILKFDANGNLIGPTVDLQPDKGSRYASFEKMTIDGKYFYIYCYSNKATIRRYEILPDPKKLLQFVDIIVQASDDRYKNLLQTDFLSLTSLFCKNGILYYLDGSINRLVIVSNEKTYMGTIQSPIMSSRILYEKLEKKPLPLGYLRNPQGVRLDRTGKIFVGNNDYSCISIFDPSGEPIANFGNLQKNYDQILPGELYSPTDFAFDKDDNIYVTDTDLEVIQVFNKNFQPVSTNKASFKSPQGIVFDSNNRLLVVNSSSATISSLENNTSVSTNFKPIDQYPIDGKWPVGIDVDQDDNMVVGITNTDAVQILSPDGEILKTIGDARTIFFNET